MNTAAIATATTPTPAAMYGADLPAVIEAYLPVRSAAYAPMPICKVEKILSAIEPPALAACCGVALVAIVCVPHQVEVNSVHVHIAFHPPFGRRLYAAFLPRLPAAAALSTAESVRVITSTVQAPEMVISSTGLPPPAVLRLSRR